MEIKRLRLAARVGADVLRAHVRGAWGRQPILLNALPKSGTHLLISAVERLPDVSRIRLQISRMNADLLAARNGEPSIPGGVAAPVPLSQQRVRRWLGTVPGGAFATAHMPWSDEFADIIRDLGIRVVLMFRDPRDVAVSAAAYIARSPTHPMHRYFTSLDEGERIAATLRGIPPGPDHPGLTDVRTRVASMTPWLGHPATLLVRFEDLVGAGGGGSPEVQVSTLELIAAHVGSRATTAELRGIAQTLFGGSATFRSGQIGGWREAFTEGHRAMAADMLDDLLGPLGYVRTDAGRQE